MQIIIKNGRVIDPLNGIDARLDVLIENGRVKAVGGGFAESAEVFDAEGLWVTPGLIDMHVHLREPGGEQSETIASGIRAAAAGGFTTVCAMANTNPVTDSRAAVEFILQKARCEGAAGSPGAAPFQPAVNVLPVGSVTKGLLGKELSPFAEMKAAGICALSDDGKFVEDPALFRRAMDEAMKLGLPVLAHCEDTRLTGRGLMHLGEQSVRHGVEGIPAEAEEIIVARDIILARSCGVRLHICHVSCARSVELVRQARAAGQNVTAEVTPHHIALTDEDIPVRNADFKMSPPIRGRGDRAAVLEGLRDGTIGVIATDHAPHSEALKAKGFEGAPNGVIGLETAVSVSISELVETKILTPFELIKKFTTGPAGVLGIDKGHLTPGAAADVTIIDPSARYVINKNAFMSLSRNTPFHGRTVVGRVVRTLVGGVVVFCV